jgi:Ca2+-binding RTX toxin-like protein
VAIERIYGGAGDDTLIGDAGDNRLRGRQGDDSLVGGDGRDMADYSYSSSGPVNANLETQRASGGAGDDTLIGFEELRGSDYDDTLIGDSGDNRFDGMGGNDSIDGGAGIDFVSYWAADSGVTVNLETDRASGGGGLDTLNNIENIEGSDYNDCLVGDSGDEYNIFYGSEGNDTIEGKASNYSHVDYWSTDVPITVDLQADTFSGGMYSQTLINISHITAGFGDDTLYGDDSWNYFQAGAGDDYIDGRGGQDEVDYGGTQGSVWASLADGLSSLAGGNDTLIGLENLYGGEYDDTLIGDNGNNFIRGRGGDDSLVGGDGFDVADYFYHDIGPIDVDLSTQRSTGGAGDDTLVGFEGLWGTRFNDTLTGDSNGNDIKGESGDDILTGVVGMDTLDGGEGSDVYLYTSDGQGGDTVLSFDDGSDTFLFDSLFFDPSATVVTFDSGGSGYDGGNAGIGDTDAHFVFDTSTNEFWYDEDGDTAGGEELIATIEETDPFTIDDTDIDFT